ncbi:MAG: glycosyltransferase family A protein [Cyanobacteria bacterium]|nr:glycosyltransferase family A protein [Cyanobacteriota bacterium]
MSATLPAPFQPQSHISAIICTHNRDRYLAKAIESLLIQTCENYEILIIDNASTDRTAEVAESYLDNPRVRYHYEVKVGLSIARNTGAQLATSPLIAYLDDDAIASPQWLQTFIEAYAQDPKLAISGGKVTLIWECAKPEWLSENLSGNLGFYDLGDQPVKIDQPGLTPRGLNYAMRRTFLDQVGGFDLNLGRVGKNLLSNEELHMTNLALQSGWNVTYLPNAIAGHHVAPERVKRSWFLERGWWQGISECYREQLAGEAGFGQLRRGSERLLRGLYKSVKFTLQGQLMPKVNARANGLVFENLVYSYGQIGYLLRVCQGLSPLNKLHGKR